jgi:hypothetical protein
MVLPSPAEPQALALRFFVGSSQAGGFQTRWQFLASWLTKNISLPLDICQAGC